MSGCFFKSVQRLTCVCVILSYVASAFNGFEVTVDTQRAIARTSERFVGVTIDTGVIVNRFTTFNPEDPLIIKLSQALYPSYLRIGGTTEDSLIFSNQQSREKSFPNVTFTENDWDRINIFAEKANFSLIFGVNSLYRPGVAWDPDNAMKLLNYSASKGYFLDWELGNEPDIYVEQFGRTVDPGQLARDFGNFRSILDSMFTFHKSRLYGPDVANDESPDSRAYLANFMKTGSRFIAAMTFHHYYMNAHTAQPADFINPFRLDSFKSTMTTAKQILQNSTAGQGTFWLSETSTAFGGGAAGLSDTFLAGFMWLDKLGLSAAYGTAVVIRQDLVGLNYGLVDYTNGVYTPNPDYWLTLLYKQLVGQTVLSTQGGDDKLRIYSHCSNARSGYGPGSVTFYMMNLYNTTQNVSFSQFAGKELHLYLLSSGNPDTLISKSICLNYVVLELSSGELPPLSPVVQSSTTVIVPPFTMGFVVIPNANNLLCLM